MKIVDYCSIAIIGFSLVSCLVVDEGAASSPSPASSHAGTEGSDAGPPGWQAGYEKGLADGQGGLSRTPDRYSYIYSEADRSGFFGGYEAGYNRGIKP